MAGKFSVRHWQVWKKKIIFKLYIHDLLCLDTASHTHTHSFKMTHTESRWTAMLLRSKQTQSWALEQQDVQVPAARWPKHLQYGDSQTYHQHSNKDLWVFIGSACKWVTVKKKKWKKKTERENGQIDREKKETWYVSVWHCSIHANSRVSCSKR